jgi:hypothetical protein
MVYGAQAVIRELCGKGAVYDDVPIAVIRFEL